MSLLSGLVAAGVQSRLTSMSECAENDGLHKFRTGTNLFEFARGSRLVTSKDYWSVTSAKFTALRFVSVQFLLILVALRYVYLGGRGLVDLLKFYFGPETPGLCID